MSDLPPLTPGKIFPEIPPGKIEAIGYRGTVYFAWLEALAAWRTLFPRLYRLAIAVRRHEGWSKGSRSWRNNNPGNLRSSFIQEGITDNFAMFLNEHQGMCALLFDLYSKCTGKTSTGLGPGSTLLQLFTVYAPPGDNNDSAQYAEVVATELGVTASTKLETFLESF